MRLGWGYASERMMVKMSEFLASKNRKVSSSSSCRKTNSSQPKTDRPTQPNEKGGEGRKRPKLVLRGAGNVNGEYTVKELTPSMKERGYSSHKQAGYE